MVSVLPWTALETPDGPRAIFTLETRTEVLSANGIWRPINYITEFAYKGPVAFVGTQKGYYLQMTESHRVLCVPKRGFEHWKYETVFKHMKGQIRDWRDSGTLAGELQVGDRVLVVDPKKHPDKGTLSIDSIRMIEHQVYDGPAYNIEVEFDHNYAANRIAVFCSERGQPHATKSEQKD